MGRQWHHRDRPCIHRHTHSCRPRCCHRCSCHARRPGRPGRRGRNSQQSRCCSLCRPILCCRRMCHWFHSCRSRALRRQHRRVSSWRRNFHLRICRSSFPSSCCCSYNSHLFLPRTLPAGRESSFRRLPRKAPQSIHRSRSHRIQDGRRSSRRSHNHTRNC